MPVHSVDLGHLVLLNVEIEDTGWSFFCSRTVSDFCLVFKPSEFAIISTDGHADFDVESKLTLTDKMDRKLELRINYMHVILKLWSSLDLHRTQTIS